MDRVEDISEAAAADAALGTGSSVVRYDDLLLSGHKERLLVLPDHLDEKAVNVDPGLLLLLLWDLPGGGIETLWWFRPLSVEVVLPITGR